MSLFPVEATASWLTRVLQQASVLPYGSITAVTIQTNAAFNSTVRHLELRYSPDAPPNTPRYLLLKVAQRHDGAHEVAWYQWLAHQLPRPAMVVGCYLAAYDAATGESALLLEDLSATHSAPVGRAELLAGQGVPSSDHLHLLLTALAQFHARWWQHPALGSGPELFAVRGWFRDEAMFAEHIARRQREWASFTTRAPGWFAGELDTLYTQALAGLPRLWSQLAPRVLAFRQLTLSQGDCYLTQFLCPQRPGATGCYLIDFDSISANFAAYDLVYLLPTFWTPAQRHDHSREHLALADYHSALRAAGVDGYSFEQLVSDYRLMLYLMLFDPIWDAGAGAPEHYWRPKLLCLAAAFEDWHCLEMGMGR